MYRKIEDFITDWEAEKNFTLKIFSNITEEIKAYQANKNTRTIERLAWHITQTLTEMPFNSGLTNTDILDNKPIPDSFAEIVDTYKKLSRELPLIIQNKWTDDTLNQKLKIYGQLWEKKKLLSVIIKHQIHHRAQITILMRLQNVKVPGTYGPSKEEWLNLGMKPHE